MAILQSQLAGKSQAELIAMLVAMDTARQSKLSFKVTARKVDPKTGKETGSDGAVSIYGLGRFPTTLYAGQWERILAAADDLKAFIAANEATISRK